jgi:hypothetical protein
MCEVLEETAAGAELEMRKPLAILSALFAHIYLALIHHSVMEMGAWRGYIGVLYLMRGGFPQPAEHLLSNHYNLTRTIYYRELARITGSGGDTLSFVGYALQGFVDGLREQIDWVRRHQLRVAWFNYVHELFDGNNSESDQRAPRVGYRVGGSGS